MASTDHGLDFAPRLELAPGQELCAQALEKWLYVEEGLAYVFLVSKNKVGLGRRYFAATLAAGDFFAPCPDIDASETDTSVKAGQPENERFGYLIVSQTKTVCRQVDAFELQAPQAGLRRLLEKLSEPWQIDAGDLVACADVMGAEASLVEMLGRTAKALYRQRQKGEKIRAADDHKEQQLLDEKFADLRDIVGLKAPHGSRQNSPNENRSAQALAAALKVIAAKNAFKIFVELSETQNDAQAALTDFCLANQWRSRRIELESGFSRLHHSALIGFYGKEAIPCILELDGENSVWYFADDERRHPLTPEQEQHFQGFAYGFYESLPKRSVRMRDVLAFAFGASRKTLASMFCAGALAGLFGLVPPIATAYVTGKIIPTANYTELWQLLVLLLSLTLGTVILNPVPQLCVLVWGSKLLERFLAALCDRIFRLPVRFFQKFSAGDLCSRLLAAIELQELFFGVVSQQFIGAVFSLLSVAVLFYYSAKLTLVAIALAAVYVLILMLLFSKMKAPLRIAADRSGWQAGFLKQVFDGVVKIQGAGAQTRVENRFLREYTVEKRARFAYLRAVGLTTVATVAIPAAVNLIFFYLIGKTWRNSLEVSQFLAFLSAYGTFQAALASIAMGVWQLAAQKPEVERLWVFLEGDVESPEGRPRAQKLDGSVEMSHVTFGYAKDAPPVVKDVTISIKPGEFAAIVGPSGSGKSSLIRLLLGFEIPDKGSILYSGQDLRELDIDSVRRQLGVILQNSRIMPGSILDNICAGTNCTLQQAQEALKMAALDKDVAAMPMGIYTNIADGLISGGQQQRVLIARALVGRPAVIIMDESTSALDNETQEKIRRNIEKLKATRIVVAHRLSTIVNADKIYVLENGTLVESGTFDELMRRDGLFKRLARRQML